jgi:hypothetical protein
MRPVYVDGPLKGQRFDTDDTFVRAPDCSGLEARSLAAGTTPPTSPLPVATYQFRKFGFHAGGKAVLVDIGWCSPAEPDAEAIARALFKPEVMERADVSAMAKDLTR